MSMSNERDNWSHERRLREAAITQALGVPPPPPVEDEPDEGDDAPRQRIEQQTLWVDQQIRAAMARGEFDNLPGAGKPLRLPDRHDPDWWVKGLIEREKITGVLPPALGLRREDSELDGELDRMATEEEVRRARADFKRGRGSGCACEVGAVGREPVSAGIGASCRVTATGAECHRARGGQGRPDLQEAS